MKGTLIFVSRFLDNYKPPPKLTVNLNTFLIQFNLKKLNKNKQINEEV